MFIQDVTFAWNSCIRKEEDTERGRIMSIRMHKYLLRFLVTGMTAILTLSICAGVAAESYTANIMRLLNYEGDVFIVDENGEYSFLMENMRFNNGESLSTSKGSMASVGLDSSKILTLDAMTQVLFETVKNQMKLTLASGRLLLDVQEKLDENQSLDIETSTMVVGIRGTVVHVSSFDGTEEEMNRRLMEANPTFQELLLKMLPDSIDGNISQLVVLEGTASATYRDENGVSRTIEVKAGEKITLVDRNQDERVDGTVAVMQAEKEDLGEATVDFIKGNPKLFDKVAGASEILADDAEDHPETPQPEAASAAAGTPNPVRAAETQTEVPEPVEIQIGEPEPAEPQTEIPEPAGMLTEPQTEAREAAEIQIGEPETAEPQTETPETAEPQTETPETAASETERPEPEEAQTETSETEEPQTHIHEESDPERENEVAATCLTAGSYDEVIYCRICGEEISRTYETEDALGHDFGEWTTAEDPTCTVPGVRRRTCRRSGCSAEEEESIPATGVHQASAPVRENEVAATCLGEGSYDEVVYCSSCGEEMSRTSGTEAALGHDFGEWTTEEDPTCIVPGVKRRTCRRSGCGAEEEESIPATGVHQAANPERENEVAATCLGEGSYYEVVYCRSCGEEISRTFRTEAALGHAYGAWTVDNAPTCSAPGVRHRTCQRSGCGAEEEESIPATGDHKASDPVRENETAAGCETAGSYEEVVYCSTCGEEMTRTSGTTAALGHDWGEWEVIEAASCQPGLERRICRRCEKTEERTIDATAAHDYIETGETDEYEYEEDGDTVYVFVSYKQCSVCGDRIKEEKKVLHDPRYDIGG